MSKDDASSFPCVLTCSTFALAVVAAVVVYGQRGGLSSLPVLLVGVGTSFVAAAIMLPGGPEKRLAAIWWWWWGYRNGRRTEGPIR